MATRFSVLSFRLQTHTRETEPLIPEYYTKLHYDKKSPYRKRQIAVSVTIEKSHHVTSMVALTKINNFEVYFNKKTLSRQHHRACTRHGGN